MRILPFWTKQVNAGALCQKSRTSRPPRFLKMHISGAARRPAQQMSFAKAAVQTLPVPKTFSNFSFSPQAQKRDSKQVFLAGSALFYAR
jgi:hypothetical protein